MSLSQIIYPDDVTFHVTVQPHNSPYGPHAGQTVGLASVRTDEGWSINSTDPAALRALAAALLEAADLSENLTADALTPVSA